MNVIFFDIDGTLVTEDSRMIIPDSTIKAVRMTRERGNLAFVNTGRTEFNVSREVRNIGFDGYICGCGTYIEYGGEVIFYKTQEQGFCRKIADICRECLVTPVYERREGYFFDDSAVYNSKLDYFRKIFVKSGVRDDRQPEDSDFGFDKFVIWRNEKSDMKKFNSEIGKYFDIIDRGDDFFEMVPLGFSKSTAIETVLEKFSISPENTFAIGDSMNDLPMLRAVKHSIAMGGAERIYPYVLYITTPIEEDGIYNALEHFGLI